MTPTPEQLQAWRKDALTDWIKQSPATWAVSSKMDNYVAGYLRAKTELLDQPEGEPVAWRRDNLGEYEYEDGITAMKDDPSAEALYTHPPAPRKITEADITEAMKEQFLKTPFKASSKDVFLAAVNAYLTLEKL